MKEEKEIVQALGQIRSELLGMIAASTEGNIKPFRAYRTIQVAKFLGIDTTDRQKASRQVRSISRFLLPYSGGNSRRRLYLGLDVLRYIAGLEPLTQAERDAMFKPQTSARKPAVRSLGQPKRAGKNGSSRVV